MYNCNNDIIIICFVLIQRCFLFSLILWRRMHLISSVSFHTASIFLFRKKVFNETQSSFNQIKFLFFFATTNEKDLFLRISRSIHKLFGTPTRCNGRERWGRFPAQEKKVAKGEHWKKKRGKGSWVKGTPNQRFFKDPGPPPPGSQNQKKISAPNTPRKVFLGPRGLGSRVFLSRRQGGMFGGVGPPPPWRWGGGWLTLTLIQTPNSNSGKIVLEIPKKKS